MFYDRMRREDSGVAGFRPDMDEELLLPEFV